MSAKSGFRRVIRALRKLSEGNAMRVIGGRTVYFYPDHVRIVHGDGREEICDKAPPIMEEAGYVVYMLPGHKKRKRKA